MSKQPRSARDLQERLRAAGFVLPTDHRDPRQCWLVVRQEPRDNEPGCFFVTHGANFDKFSNRPGFEVLAHTFDRELATKSARRATEICGPQYQPKFSAHKEVHSKPAPEGGDYYDDLVEGPLHDLDDFLNQPKDGQ